MKKENLSITVAVLGICALAVVNAQSEQKAYVTKPVKKAIPCQMASCTPTPSPSPGE